MLQFCFKMPDVYDVCHCDVKMECLFSNTDSTGLLIF